MFAKVSTTVVENFLKDELNEKVFAEVKLINFCRSFLVQTTTTQTMFLFFFHQATFKLLIHPFCITLFAIKNLQTISMTDLDPVYPVFGLYFAMICGAFFFLRVLSECSHTPLKPEPEEKKVLFTIISMYYIVF